MQCFYAPYNAADYPRCGSHSYGWISDDLISWMLLSNRELPFWRGKIGSFYSIGELVCVPVQPKATTPTETRLMT